MEGCQEREQSTHTLAAFHHPCLFNIPSYLTAEAGIGLLFLSEMGHLPQFPLCLRARTQKKVGNLYAGEENNL